MYERYMFRDEEVCGTLVENMERGPLEIARMRGSKYNAMDSLP